MNNKTVNLACQYDDKTLIVIVKNEEGDPRFVGTFDRDQPIENLIDLLKETDND